MPTIHAIFLLTVWRIRMFISLKPSASQGKSSLKISARRDSPRRFGGVREQTNTLTHSLTDWCFYRVIHILHPCPWMGLEWAGRLTYLLRRLVGGVKIKAPPLKVTNIRLLSKKGLNNEWHDLACQEEEEMYLCFYDIFLPYNENIFL